MDDFDERGGLPSWIPQQLIDIERQKVAGNTAKVVDTTFSSLDKIKGTAQRAPQNSIPSLISFLGFTKNKEGIYPNFLGKSIVDIGGGFGGVAPTLSFSAKELIVVDPVFREQDLSSLLEKEIKGQNEMLRLRKNYLDNHPEKLNVKNDIDEATQVLQDLYWWQMEYLKERYPHIKRNNSYGEMLVGIADNSQDYVFLNYVLSKETVNPEKVILEAKRVLKQGGKIIVSDYQMENKVLEFIESEFDVDIKEDDKRVIFIGKKR